MQQVTGELFTLGSTNSQRRASDMNDILTGSIACGQAAALQRGEVTEVDGAGTRVRLLGGTGETIVCDVLASGVDAAPRCGRWPS
jgi:hypothetical protein